MGTEEESERTTWEPVELSEVLAALDKGALERPSPTLGRRSDEVGLFYAGRVNGLSGESGNGKSWIAQYVCAQELRAGRHCVFIDFEDRAEGVCQRLYDLGVSTAVIGNQFHYLAPERPFGVLAAAQMVGLVKQWQPSVVVIDSTGEAMAVENVKQNDDDAVARWFRLLPRLLADRGPGVLLNDHVTKDTENRGLHAIGSQRKRAAITGATYMVDVTREFGKGVAGSAKLTCAKDRNGTHLRGRIAAHFTLDASKLELLAMLAAPLSAEEAGAFRPTGLMERISRALEGLPAGEGLSKGAIEGAVKGKATVVRLALETLVAEGFIIPERKGPAHLHRLVRPYREADETDDNEEEEQGELPEQF